MSDYFTLPVSAALTLDSDQGSAEILAKSLEGKTLSIFAANFLLCILISFLVRITTESRELSAVARVL